MHAPDAEVLCQGVQEQVDDFYGGVGEEGFEEGVGGKGGVEKGSGCVG